VNLSHTHCLFLIHVHSRALGGGGAGSGGAVSFSACTLTAGSSAKIEAKGGTGGRARNYDGTKLFCHVCLACACLISHSNQILYTCI